MSDTAKQYKERVEFNSQRLMNLSLGVKGLGELLSLSDDISYEQQLDLSYLLTTVGEVMAETLNDSTRAEIELVLKNEGKK